MQLLKVVLISLIATLLVACGGMGPGAMTSANPNASTSMTGNWTATMMDQNGAQAMSFTAALSQSSGNVVTASNIQFMTPTSCFASGTSGTGAVMPGNNMMSGSMMQSFGMSVQSGNTQSGSMGMPMGMTGNNILTLQGSMSNMNTVSGTWTMSGVASGCSGSGTFTMTRM